MAVFGFFPAFRCASCGLRHYSVDASGQLEPFKVKGNNKGNIQEKLMSIADAEIEIDWAGRFCQVCNVIDTALMKLSDGLVGH